ncbi:MAG TPA: DUF4272 domain-containing protein [Tepidisphaeraceae bacterium]|jgi:hypothetical protein|nr:DUF4272 domain-containing protein [Tepidisphaeraceae bacterium]
MTQVQSNYPRLTTEQWARSFGISTVPTPPTVAGFDEPYGFTAREIATRAIVLQGVVAVACGVYPAPVVNWLTEQNLWDSTTPIERDLFADPHEIDGAKRNWLCWHQEAEWALLWVIEKVEVLDLPTRACDTRRLVDDIIPKLGSDVEPFLASARLRSPGVLLAEVDRHYNLWCRYIQCRKSGPRAIPSDLMIDVLYHREYAFEWLDGIEAWDDVQCDA